MRPSAQIRALMSAGPRDARVSVPGHRAIRSLAVGVLAVCALVVGSLGAGSVAMAQASLMIEGTVAAALPEDARVSVRIVSETGGGSLPEPLASAPIIEGRFELVLPAPIDSSWLEQERANCAGDELMEVAYLPFLTVDSGGESIGALYLSSVPPQLWGPFGPPAHAYFVYSATDRSIDQECGGQTMQVEFEEGWNTILVMVEGDGVMLTDDPPPEGFSWHFRER